MAPDFAVLLNKNTFEPDPTVLTYKVDSSSKRHMGMVLLIIRGLLRVHLSLDHRLLLSTQCTFTISWPRSVMHLQSFSSAFVDEACEWAKRLTQGPPRRTRRRDLNLPATQVDNDIDDDERMLPDQQTQLVRPRPGCGTSQQEQQVFQ